MTRADQRLLLLRLRLFEVRPALFAIFPIRLRPKNYSHREYPLVLRAPMAAGLDFEKVGHKTRSQVIWV